MTYLETGIASIRRLIRKFPLHFKLHKYYIQINLSIISDDPTQSSKVGWMRKKIAWSHTE